MCNIALVHSKGRRKSVPRMPRMAASWGASQFRRSHDNYSFMDPVYMSPCKTRQSNWYEEKSRLSSQHPPSLTKTTSRALWLDGFDYKTSGAIHVDDVPADE
jgi:hypothetical protein